MHRRRSKAASVGGLFHSSLFSFRLPQCISLRSGLNSRTTLRCSAFMTPIRAICCTICPHRYSNATPIRKSVRRTIRQDSFNPSSGTTKMNFSGILPGSNTSIDAPVVDRSRRVQLISSPPYSIMAGFLTRNRGAARVSTILPYLPPEA